MAKGNTEIPSHSRRHKAKEGRTALSWELNGSLKKKERKCTTFRGCFIENTIASMLLVSKENVNFVIRGCESLLSEQMLPVRLGLKDPDISPSLSSHPLLYLISPVATICRSRRTFLN